MAIACSSNSEILLISKQPIGDIGFECPPAVLCASRVEKKAAAGARNVENIVYICFPVVRRPVDCVRNDGGNAFGNSIRSDHIERFRVTRLKQQVHVSDSFCGNWATIASRSF